MKDKIQLNWKTFLAALLVTGLVWLSWAYYISGRTNQARLQKDLETKQSLLDKKLKELNLTQEQKKQLETEKADLAKQLQGKREQQAKDKVYAESLPKQATPVPSVAGVTNCGSDPYMAQIYMKESGCRTDALNSIGCFGIGQSCPKSKIAHCGTDFACQNAWFTNYAITRYGSPANAWAVWQQQHWW